MEKCNVNQEVNRGMPSKTRATRITKTAKENILCAVKINNLKGSAKVLKSARQPLSDKTNSTSDDASTLPSEKHLQTVNKKRLKSVCQENVDRPKRTRRVPTRYKENIVLKKLSNSLNLTSKHESPVLETSEIDNKSSLSNTSQVTQQPPASKAAYTVRKKPPMEKVPFILLSPLKSPLEICDGELVKNRPKRICRLPRKFNDHSISPNKYVPVQPINASTPLATKVRKPNFENVKENISLIQNMSLVKLTKKTIEKGVITGQGVINNVVNLKKADSNNNAKQTNKPQVSPSPRKLLRTRSTAQKLLYKSNSPLLLENNKYKHKRDSSKLDVYEFTYDPDQEPPPAKKKKRKAPRRPKPKTITLKSNYDKNLAKALAALKNTVASKPSNVEIVKQSKDVDFDSNYINPSTQGYNPLEADKENAHKESNYNSVQVEDIANDIHDIAGHAIDYSPVNSPIQSESPTFPVHEVLPVANNADPLNLHDELSFIDALPVASSSMNVSVRHPLASPWRTEYSDLPIKWHVNTYVKPNMTPAIESSFFNFNDSKKKHVYTHLVPESNEPLPQMANNTNCYKQTSIMSFIKEVVEKNANKKKKNKLTPVKANSLFEDLTSNSIVNHATPNKQTPLKNNTNINTIPERVNQLGEGNDSTPSLEKQHSDIAIENVLTPKDLNKNADKNNTYFGFDDVDDQENVSPIKKNRKARSLRSRTRGILQEINGLKGPTRAVIPIAIKSKPAQNAVNKVYEGVKSATEPPVFPEFAVTNNAAITNVQEICTDNNDDTDSQSVHLFEDIECLHQHKANRKSYGKAKKVTFRKKSGASDGSVSDVDGRSDLHVDDNLDDLSFKLPSEEPKRRIRKRKPKKQMSKKEAKEVEEWAAGFNSMCEDIDRFDLIVE